MTPDPAFQQAPSTWRLIVDVTAPIPGGLEDWPAQIADPILRAIERQCKCRVGWEAQVFFSGCMRNYDKPVGEPGAYFLDVQVGEFPAEETQRAWRAGRLH